MNKKINRKKRNIFYVICNPEDLNEDVYIHLQLREGSLRARYSAWLTDSYYQYCWIYSIIIYTLNYYGINFKANFIFIEF